MLAPKINAQNVYTERFLELRKKMNDPNNGYFSKDGVPYHSVETLMAEAPDQGHETTSEAYSYWIWMEAMYGGISGDWSPLNNAWDKLEKFAIPTAAMQPTSGDYKTSDPADYAGEHALPSLYPTPTDSSVPVGEDPISGELKNTYGDWNVYAMHWLFDCDNFYGYGNMGDGKSTPSYINTFQRGEQESVWETVPHPSWEDFSWGDPNNGGFMGISIKDPKYTKQWRYTNAPDADARVVQAMYWASEFAKQNGENPASVLPLDKAVKMGDYGRLAMFDKYFKKIGCQSKSDAGGKGYESAHYLLSWYFAWGGPIQSNNWAWRIGASHAHFGYQNPMAAYALSEVGELKPKSPNGASDWGKSLKRQLEFYTWLQSSEGAIAGGASNSVDGQYNAHPAGVSTFYDMVYIEHPVYKDPGSNQWFGMQAWSMERIAELYYVKNDPMAKKLLDKWVAWVKSEVELKSDGTYAIPATLEWSGQPDSWSAGSSTTNANLHVSVKDKNQDVGVAACLAKALTYYAAGTKKHDVLDDEARELAKQILDRVWDNYYEPAGKGVAVEEKREDYKRFFEQEVFVPEGFNGKMPNGDVVKPGVKFIDIRSNYKKDPEFAKLEAAYNTGGTYKAKYHRFWAQADIALANAEYGRLFGVTTTASVTGVNVTPATLELEVGAASKISATVMPFNAANKNVSWSSSDVLVASVDNAGLVTAVSAGTATITATTEEGSFTGTCVVTINEAVVITCPTIALDFDYSGVGDQCWFTTDDIANINSWSLEELTVNGVDYTNKWSNSMPAKVNGGYTISFKSKNSWGTVQIKAAARAVTVSNGVLTNNTLKLFPNPSNKKVTVSGIENAELVQVIASSGQMVFERNVRSQSELTISVEGLIKGMYLVKVVGIDGKSVTKKLIVQ
ncbi:hypothetical protein BZG02_14605 [Labilibaculum filiforme]|uniref:BIG2 domain-containing protein n=2 Tax=Labilibaculum filiforme TaxID=1940526 RepID=A0A2N3HUY2_9BACT|nr:hypothetical protein BZG02_14605 [Labilibaculum filiforme]